MAILRKTLLATAIVSAGLASTTGVALADDHGGDASQKGLVNSSDFAPNTPLNVCNNDVPVNVLGVQVPIQDLGLAVPVLSEAHHGNSAGVSKSCSNPIKAQN